MTLSSERTLWNYTNYFQNKPGFQDEVNQQLFGEIPKDLPDTQRYVAVLVDEMKATSILVSYIHP